MGEIARTQQRDPLAPGPPGERLQFQVTAAGAGVLGVDVQVSDESGRSGAERGHAASCHEPGYPRAAPRPTGTRHAPPERQPPANGGSTSTVDSTGSAAP